MVVFVTGFMKEDFLALEDEIVVSEDYQMVKCLDFSFELFELSFVILQISLLEFGDSFSDSGVDEEDLFFKLFFQGSYSFPLDGFHCNEVEFGLVSVKDDFYLIKFFRSEKFVCHLIREEL